MHPALEACLCLLRLNELLEVLLAAANAYGQRTRTRVQGAQDERDPRMSRGRSKSMDAETRT